MTVVEGAGVPRGGGGGAAWDMIAVVLRRLGPRERLDGVDGVPVWVLVLDGEVRLEAAGRAHPLDAGDAFHADGRTPCRLVALTAAQVAVGTLRAVPPRQEPLIVRDFASGNRGIVELVRMCPLDPRREQPLFAASYGGLIQSAMLRTLDEDARRGPDPRLTALVSVLDAHPGRPWTVESMARVAHLSRSSLGERFRRDLGRSPAQVLREVRMRHARALLAGTDKPVEQIAFTVGYGSAAAFSRAFSAYHGSSPQGWRSRPPAVQCGEPGARGEGRDRADQ